MANFMGGSAPAMAAQIADGFILVSAATLKGYGPGDLASLKIELENRTTPSPTRRATAGSPGSTPRCS